MVNKSLDKSTMINRNLSLIDLESTLINIDLSLVAIVVIQSINTKQWLIDTRSSLYIIINKAFFTKFYKHRLGKKLSIYNSAIPNIKKVSKGYSKVYINLILLDSYINKLLVSTIYVPSL